MSIQLSQIRVSLEDGLLSFPITDMDDHGNFHPDTYAQRIAWFLQHGVSSVFVAGGTGEFFSLSMEEYTQIVKTACEVVKDNAPVISSVGRVFLKPFSLPKSQKKPAFMLCY